MSSQPKDSAFSRRTVNAAEELDAKNGELSFYSEYILSFDAETFSFAMYCYQ